MKNLARLRKRRNELMGVYASIVLSNIEKGIFLNEEESILLNEWGMLNDRIISLKKLYVQQLNTDAKSNGLGI